MLSQTSVSILRCIILDFLILFKSPSITETTIWLSLNSIHSYNSIHVYFGTIPCFPCNLVNFMDRKLQLIMFSNFST
jgi:hypothetical protein